MFPSILYLVALTGLVLADSSNCTRSYTVKTGDTCDSICTDTKTSSYQLAVLNPSIDDTCSNIAVDQKLCLGGPDSEDCRTAYTVQDTDTCVSILRSQNINATMLWTNNPYINAGCDNIYPGQVLCVANQVQVPPAPATGIPTPTHASQSAPASTTAAPTATPTDDSDDDDDKLPYCDEL